MMRLGVELVPMERSHAFQLHTPAAPGIVYVRHPRSPTELIVFADYDERLAQEHYEEALRVFTSLGAARIVATSRRETSKQLAGNVGSLGKKLTLSGSKD